MTDTTQDSGELKQQLLEAGHESFDAADYTRALDNYHRAALLDSRDAAVWTALGLTFSNLDFPREAWRSYLLALNMERGHLDALWYAAEFLFQIEDLPLADMFLSQYLQLEQDADKLADARELQSEIHAEAEARGITLQTTRSSAAREVLDSEHSAEIQEQIEQQPDAEEEQEDDEQEIQLSEEELEAEAMNAGRFVPQLSLRLSGFEGICHHCGLRIPWDAPYCWSCKMIHFYD